MYEMDLLDNTENVNRLLARYGVKFGIYKNNTFKEQLFPFDAIPRVIQKKEFDYLERGLKQRVAALNLFLDDIYHDKKIVRDKVIPEDFIFASSGYMPECEGVTPVKKVYSHISGIDLVKGKNEEWYILEDNLRVPSGASYPMIARDLCRRSSPKTFRDNQLEDNRNYAQLLRKTMDNVNVEGHTVILTPGRYNAAYFEHSYLAEKTGAHLVNGSELVVENDKLYYVDYKGKKSAWEQYTAGFPMSILIRCTLIRSRSSEFRIFLMCIEKEILRCSMRPEMGLRTIKASTILCQR